MNIVQHRSEILNDEGHGLSTVCILCAHNCGLEVDVEANRIVRVRADSSNPRTQGYSCNKGYTIGHYVDHAQRISSPLQRLPNGDYQAVSWDTAIEQIGARLRAIIDQDGGRAVALNGLGGQGNHLSILYGLSFLESIGSPWFFCTFAQEKTQHTLVDRWMMNAPTHALLHADAWHSEYVLVIGTNPLVSHRNERPTQLFSQLSKGTKQVVVVVDPRRTETAQRADRHLAIAPGRDAYFLMGMVKHILDKRLHDPEFVTQRTVDFERLGELFQTVDIDTMAQRCDLDANELREVATDFAQSQRACVFYDLGIEQIPFLTLVSWLIRVLLALTGNLARAGGNVFTPTFKPMTDRMEPRSLFRSPVSGIEGIPALGPFAMFSPNLLPEEIEAGNIRALIVDGANPLISYPDTERFRAALRRLDLLVVIEPAFTETAREADFVLPTPTGYEKWEWSTHNHRFPEIYAQLRPPVVQGPAEALPEAEIYSRMVQAIGRFPDPPRLLQRLARQDPRSSKRFKIALLSLAALRSRGRPLRVIPHLIFWGYQLAGPWLANPAIVSIWLNCLLFAVTRRADALRSLGAEWHRRSPFAIGEELFRRILEQPHGVEVGRVDELNHFRDMCRTRGRRMHLVPEVMAEELRRALQTPQADDAEYPSILCAGERHLWNANTLQRDPSWRKSRRQHFSAKIHPQTATALGIEDGEQVRIVTRIGSLQAPAMVTDSVKPNYVTLPNGFGMDYPDADGQLRTEGGKINVLTDLDDRDPFTGIPYLKIVRCRIEKATVSSTRGDRELG